MSNDRIVLTCACCKLPFGYIQRGVLVIHSRHGGEKHINTIPLPKDVIAELTAQPVQPLDKSNVSVVHLP